MMILSWVGWGGVGLWCWWGLYIMGVMLAFGGGRDSTNICTSRLFTNSCGGA